MHFNVEVDCELNKCHANDLNDINQIAIHVTTDTDSAPFGVHQFLTAAKRKPHLIATKNSTSRSIIVGNSMVRRTTGDGLSSIQKRHIIPSSSSPFKNSTVSTSFTTTTTTTTTTSPSTLPVSHSINQHTTISGLELESTTFDPIQTTFLPFAGDGFGPMILPYSMGKRTRHG